MGWLKRLKEKRELKKAIKEGNTIGVEMYLGYTDKTGATQYDAFYTDLAHFCVYKVTNHPEYKGTIRRKLYNFIDHVQDFTKVRVIVTPQTGGIFYAYSHFITDLDQHCTGRKGINKDTKWTLLFDKSVVTNQVEYHYDFHTQMCFDICDYIYECIKLVGKMNFRIDFIVDDPILL